MATESLIERQCGGSTHKGEMLVGQHGWDSLEENGTIIVDDEEEKEFWLLQVMVTSEVDSGRREDCFGFKKNLGPLHMGKSFRASNFGDDWSKMKKTGKGLQKFGLIWRHWFFQRSGLLGDL